MKIKCQSYRYKNRAHARKRLRRNFLKLKRSLKRRDRQAWKKHISNLLGV